MHTIEDIQKKIERISNLEGEKYNFILQCLTNYIDAVGILIKKGNDYATVSDPYKNFRINECIGTSIERSLILECGKKFARLANILEKDTVSNESIDDNLTDSMNYMCMLITYRALYKNPVAEIPASIPKQTRVVKDIDNNKKSNSLEVEDIEL